jgi:hypothetical protein
LYFVDLYFFCCCSVTSSIYPVIFGTNATSNLHGACQRDGIEHAHSTGVLQAPFECRLEFLDSTSKYLKASALFQTQAVFDIDRMTWACQITSRAFHDQHHSSTHDDSLRLFIQTSYTSSSDPLILAYQPTFKLSSSSIYLSEEHPYQSIEIFTLPNNEQYLHVQLSDPAIVRIRKNTTDPFVYTVELRHGAKTAHRESIYIEISNRLTGQNQRVNIKVQQRFIDNPIGRVLASLLLCASLALIVYGLANRKTSSSIQTAPMISQPAISSTPRVIHSPSTPKRHLLFDDQHTSYDRNPLESPIANSQHVHQDQPVVRLYSAQDLRSRSIVTPPRSAMSSMNVPTTDDGDLRRRLQRFRDDN